MTGMLDRVLGFAAPTPPKKRQTVNGTPRGGSLAEALRARGGTQNLQTVIAHKEAASDTEAFAPTARRPARQSMPAAMRPDLTGPSDGARPLSQIPQIPLLPLARSRSDDDSVFATRSSDSNLGWLDLQAFAPKALQKQLERLMESVNNEDGDGAGGIAAVRSSAQAALAGLNDRRNDLFSNGSAGDIATPRGGQRMSSASSSGLRAALLKRGGMRGQGPDPEEGCRGTEQAEAADCPVTEQEEPPKLSAVPEDEEIAGQSPKSVPLPSDHTPAVEPMTLEETTAESADSSSANVTESAASEAPDHGADPLATETADAHIEAEAVQDSRDLAPASELEIPASSSTTPAASVPSASPAPTRSASSASSAPPASAKVAADEAPSASWLRPQTDDSSARVISSASSSEAKVQKPPLAQWCPGSASSCRQWPPKDEAKADASEDEAKLRTGTASKFKDAREFWGKHSISFAGPSLGNKSISKKEAEAALQRLLSNGASCDPSEVRRLKKLIDY